MVLEFVSGDELSQFRPNQPLTKLEAIAMSLNAEGFQDDVDNYTLLDEEQTLLKKIPEWGKKYVAMALQEELILPYELQRFNPQQGINRYEVCTYLSRINGDTEVVPQRKRNLRIGPRYQKIIEQLLRQSMPRDL